MKLKLFKLIIYNTEVHKKQSRESEILEIGVPIPFINTKRLIGRFNLNEVKELIICK